MGIETLVAIGSTLGASGTAAAVVGGAVVAGGALSVYSSIEQSKQAKKAAGYQQQQAIAQNKQLEAQRKLANVRNMRERRRIARSARVARAETISRAEQTGTGGGSAIAGEVSSVGAQLGFNMGFLDTAQRHQSSAVSAGQEAALFGGRANIAQGRGATAAAIGGIGGTIFAGADGFKTIFKGIG